MFCQVFEQPTQRPVSISPSIVIEAKKAHKVGERSSCSAILLVGELYERGLVVLGYEIKTYEKFSVSDMRKFAPTKNFPL